MNNPKPSANTPYHTPCTPVRCERYTIDGCGRQSVCERFINYTELKSAIRTESATYYKTYIKRTQSVDHHFRQQIPVRKV